MFTSGPHDNGPFNGSGGPFNGGGGFGDVPPSDGMFNESDCFDPEMFGLEPIDFADVKAPAHHTVDVGLHFHGTMRAMRKTKR